MTARMITEFQSAILYEFAYWHQDGDCRYSSYPGDGGDCTPIEPSLADTYGKRRVYCEIIKLIICGCLRIREGKLSLSKRGQDSLLAYEAAAWDYPEIV